MIFSRILEIYLKIYARPLDAWLCQELKILLKINGLVPFEGRFAQNLH